MKLSIPFHAITSLVLLGTSTTSATSNLRRRLQHKDSKGHQDDARSLSTPTAVAYEYEMLLAPGGACRINSPSNSGTQNTDFFRSKQPSLSTCQNMCSIRSDCVAIEFSENNGDCEIWITLPNKVGDVSGLKCYLKGDPIPSVVVPPPPPPPPTAVAYEYEMLLAPGGACRINSPSNSGTKDTDFFKYQNQTMPTCQAMCSIRPDCEAIEFSENSRDCEIWITLPNTVSQVSDLKCYLKGDPIPSVVVPPPPPPSQPQPDPPITVVDNEPDYKQCDRVHRRPIYGTGGDAPFDITSYVGLQSLVKVYSPFDPDVPEPSSGKDRWWRVYAVYFDEKHPAASSSSSITSATTANVRVVFDFDGSSSTTGQNVIFTLPQIAGTDKEYRGEGYSDSHQFDSGSANAINTNDATVYLEFQSSANTSTNNHLAVIYWIVLDAYDC